MNADSAQVVLAIV